jgi:hypothetical protein
MAQCKIGWQKDSRRRNLRSVANSKKNDTKMAQDKSVDASTRVTRLKGEWH